MAKRLTDTTKWQRENFQALSPKLKCAWFYVTDNCDHAGIWHPNFPLMSFQIGEAVTEAEFLLVFKDKVVKLPNGAFFLPSYIQFQYHLPLNPENNAHKGVLRVIQRWGLERFLEPLTSPSPGAAEGLVSPSSGAQEKEQEKEQQQEKDLEQEKGKLPEFEKVECGDFLDDVKKKAQLVWIKTHGLELVQKELPTCWAKWVSDESRNWQGRKALYINEWMARVRKAQAQAPPPVSELARKAGAGVVSEVEAIRTRLHLEELASMPPPTEEARRKVREMVSQVVSGRDRAAGVEHD